MGVEPLKPVDPLDPLGELTERLRRAAVQLRGGELSSEQAAELVEECARTAGEAAAELDRLARTAASEPAPPASPGQGELL